MNPTERREIMCHGCRLSFCLLCRAGTPKYVSTVIFRRYRRLNQLRVQLTAELCDIIGATKHLLKCDRVGYSRCDVG